MNEILAAAVALPTLGLAVLVFGFAPGLVNRLFACVYPPGDSRRKEMIAELYAVPRIEQPFWVAQQAERSLSEGIPARMRARRARKVIPVIMHATAHGSLTLTVSATHDVQFKAVIGYPEASDATSMAWVEEELGNVEIEHREKPQGDH